MNTKFSDIFSINLKWDKDKFDYIILTSTFIECRKHLSSLRNSTAMARSFLHRATFDWSSSWDNVFILQALVRISLRLVTWEELVDSMAPRVGCPSLESWLASSSSSSSEALESRIHVSQVDTTPPDTVTTLGHTSSMRTGAGNAAKTTPITDTATAPLTRIQIPEVANNIANTAAHLARMAPTETSMGCPQCCDSSDSYGCQYGSYLDYNGCQHCCTYSSSCPTYGSYPDLNGCPQCCSSGFIYASSGCLYGTGNVSDTNGCKQCCPYYNANYCSLQWVIRRCFWLRSMLR